VYPHDGALACGRLHPGKAARLFRAFQGSFAALSSGAVPMMPMILPFWMCIFIY
jgi:hypothetical protein